MKIILLSIIITAFAGTAGYYVGDHMAMKAGIKEGSTRYNATTGVLEFTPKQEVAAEYLKSQMERATAPVMSLPPQSAALPTETKKQPNRKGK